MRRRPKLPPTIILAPAWKRRPAATCVLLVVVLLVVLTRATTEDTDDQARYHNRVFTVVHVADGDTFDIDAPDGGEPRTRIRLWGVDTPELGRGSDPPMHFAEEAADFARQALLHQPVRVLLARERTRDKYDRLLAYVQIEATGAQFNEMLIEHGLAYADWRFPHPNQTRYQQLERRARESRAGLWAKVTPAEMPAWRSRKTAEAEPRP